MQNVIVEFLESSTIHGLNFISRPGKLLKSFWILVVIGGFTGAGFMIYQSLENWADSPVKTTVETLPITEVTLPKVTVCPPKNTFTNLNYDIMMLKNVTMNNDTRNELIEYAVATIQDHVYNDIISNVSKLQEENRYFNWYSGYTEIRLPYWGIDPNPKCRDKSCAEHRLRHLINTFATSGTIATQYYNDLFDPYKIERALHYSINILPPIQQNNTSLHINIEKNLVQGVDRFYDRYENPVTTLNRTITNSYPNSMKWYSINLKRQMSEDNIDDIKMDIMPTFRLSWHYSDFFSPQPNYQSKNITFEFRR